MTMTSSQCVPSVLCHIGIVQGDVALSSGNCKEDKFRESFRLKATAVNHNMQLYTGWKDLLQQNEQTWFLAQDDFARQNESTTPDSLSRRGKKQSSDKLNTYQHSLYESSNYMNCITHCKLHLPLVFISVAYSAKG